MRQSFGSRRALERLPHGGCEEVRVHSRSLQIIFPGVLAARKTHVRNSSLLQSRWNLWPFFIDVWGEHTDSHSCHSDFTHWTTETGFNITQIDTDSKFSWILTGGICTLCRKSPVEELRWEKTRTLAPPAKGPWIDTITRLHFRLWVGRFYGLEVIVIHSKEIGFTGTHFDTLEEWGLGTFSKQNWKMGGNRPRL